MTGDDLIVAARWLAWAAGLVVIGWRPAAVAAAGVPACRNGAHAPGPARAGPMTGRHRIAAGYCRQAGRIGQLRTTAGTAMVKAWRHPVAPAIPHTARPGRRVREAGAGGE